MFDVDPHFTWKSHPIKLNDYIHNLNYQNHAHSFYLMTCIDRKNGLTRNCRVLTEIFITTSTLKELTTHWINSNWISFFHTTYSYRTKDISGTLYECHWSMRFCRIHFVVNNDSNRILKLSIKNSIKNLIQLIVLLWLAKKDAYVVYPLISFYEIPFELYLDHPRTFLIFEWFLYDCVFVE